MDWNGCNYEETYEVEIVTVNANFNIGNIVINWLSPKIKQKRSPLDKQRISALPRE